MYQDEHYQMDGNGMNGNAVSSQPIYEKLDKNGKSFQKRTSDGLALAAMIIGIVSVATMCCLGGFLGIVGIVLGIIALVDKECKRKAKAIVGLVLSAFALLVTIWVLGSGNFKKMIDNKKGPEKEEITSEFTEETGKDMAVLNPTDRNETDEKEKATEDLTTEEPASVEVPDSDSGLDSGTDESDNEAGNNNIRPEFKEAVDSYEAFIDEYMELLDAYTDPNTTSAEILLKYADYMNKYAKLAEDFSKLGDEEMNEAEALYYSAASARIAAKITEHSAKMMLMTQ